MLALYHLSLHIVLLHIFSVGHTRKTSKSYGLFDGKDRLFVYGLGLWQRISAVGEHSAFVAAVYFASLWIKCDAAPSAYTLFVLFEFAFSWFPFAPFRAEFFCIPVSYKLRVANGTDFCDFHNVLLLWNIQKFTVFKLKKLNKEKAGKTDIFRHIYG